MESKVLKQERTIYKVSLFYMLVIIWSIIAQFLPIPLNAYQYTAFLIPISIYLFTNRKDAERILKPNVLNIKSIVIIFIIWFCTLPILIAIVTLYTKLFGDKLANIIAHDSHNTFIGNLIFTAITPAIFEEILMRGIILDGYRNKSCFVAALMNGLLFGMLHLNSFQFFYTFIAGFIASYLVFATNSLYAGMIIHFINNGLPIILDYLYPPDPNIGYASSTSFFSSLVWIIFSVVAIYILIHLLAKVNGINLKKRKNISDEKIFNTPLIISIVLFILFSVILIALL